MEKNGKGRCWSDGKDKKRVCIIGFTALLISLTCKDKEGKHELYKSSEAITDNATNNNAGKLPFETNIISPKSGNSNDFAFVVLGKLSVSGGKTFYVNGPLADVCVTTLKNDGNFKVTGKLSVGTLQGSGQLEYEEIEENVTCDFRVSPPSVTDFIRGQRVIWFGHGWVEEYDENRNLVKRFEGKFYKDPSGAEWIYKDDGSWGMKGEIPSRLEWYTLVFETDFRNPAKTLDIYDGGIYVMGKMKDSGNLIVRDKPDEWSMVVLEDVFFTSDIDITGKVYIRGNMRFVGEDEDFKGEYRYKIKGNLFVGGDFTCNVNFSLNNLELAQKVADAIVLKEVEGGKLLEWVQTTPVGGADLGEPGIVFSVYRVPQGVSLSPPMSRFRTKSSDARDIHELRSIYRRVEGGRGLEPYNESGSKSRRIRGKSEGDEENLAIEQLMEENLITIVIGASMNYGVYLADLGSPVHLTNLTLSIERLKEQGYQNIEVRRIFFIPSPLLVAEFYADGNTLYVPIYPIESNLETLTQETITKVMDNIRQIMEIEEGKRARKADWEYYRALVKGISQLAPLVTPQVRFEPKSSDEKELLPSKCVKEWEESKIDYAPKCDDDKYCYSYCKGVSWVFIQPDVGGLFCGPTVAAQLFTWWRIERDKECIESDRKKLALELEDAMGTLDWEGRGKGPTFPWNADEGIENVAAKYGYSVDANWIQKSPEEDVRNSIRSGRPALWVTAINSDIVWYFYFLGLIPGVVATTIEYIAKEGYFHYWLIIGYERIERKFIFDFLVPDKWYFYVFNNWDYKLHRHFVTWWSMWGLGWSVIITSNFGGEPYTYYYRDNDKDGYGNPRELKRGCKFSPPQGYVSNNIDCDDANAYVHPGAKEVCNYIDDDCDGNVDEGLTVPFYLDFDKDGYGSEEFCEIFLCTIPGCPGDDKITYLLTYVPNRDDCDDSKSSVYPGAPEICDGLDNNCDGKIPPEESDLPHMPGTPCDGSDSDYCEEGKWECIGPNSVSCSDTTGDNELRCGDSIDDDCDGRREYYYYLDEDGDGYGRTSISVCMNYVGSSTEIQGKKYTIYNGDCNDNPNDERAKYIHPDQCEVCNGGIDDDCDGLSDYSDPDAGTCSKLEICGNQIDENCDGRVDQDCTCAIAQSGSNLPNILPIIISALIFVITRKKRKSLYIYALFFILFPLFYSCILPRGVIATGSGWSADVVIHNGVIHTASYNYSDMILKYAYKSITEDVWHIEVVEKFFDKGEAYNVGGIEYGGFLKMAVNDEAVYIVYAGLKKTDGDGILNGVWEDSIKLAIRPFDEKKWYVREITKALAESRPRICNFIISGKKAYICVRSELGTELFILDLITFDLITYDIEKLLKLNICSIFPVENFVYIVYYDYIRNSVRIFKLNTQSGEVEEVFEKYIYCDGVAGISDIISSNGKLEFILHCEWSDKGAIDFDSTEHKFIHIVGEPWTVSELYPPKIPKNSILFLEQVRHSKYLFALFTRYDEKTKIGVARVDEGNFIIDWIEAPGTVESISFDVSYPYIAISFLTVELGTILRNGGEFWVWRPYSNYIGKHMAYIFDGERWRKEEVK